VSNWQDVPNAMTPAVWYSSRDLATRLDLPRYRINEMVNNAVVQNRVHRKSNPDKPRQWLYTLA
jgi:hypothetical protein